MTDPEELPIFRPRLGRGRRAPSRDGSGSFRGALLARVARGRVARGRAAAGAVASKGLSDELEGDFYAVLETPTGAEYHVPLDMRSVEEL